MEAQPIPAMVGPGFDDVREQVRAETRRILLQRVRAVLWLFLGALPFYSLVDLYVYPESVRRLSLLRAAAGVMIAAGLLLLRGRPTREWAVRAGLLGVTAMCVTAAISAVILHDDRVMPILSVMFVMASASLLPWGLLPHGLIIAITSLASLWNVYAVRGTLPVPDTYVGAVLAWVWAGSIYIAYQLQRDRFALAQYNLDRQRAEQTVQHRLEFEQLITNLSTNFINLAPAEIDRGITAALRAVGQFAGVDRSYIFLFSDDGHTMDLAYECSADDAEVPARQFRGVPATRWPWLIERLRRFEVVHIARVADLPPEASAEKQIHEERGVLAAVNVPMVSGGSLVGFLGFASLRAEKTWEAESIALLKIVGEMFVNALARKRAEAALRASEERYRDLFENANDVIYTHNLKGIFTSINRATERICGYSRQEAFTMHYSDVVAPEYLEAATRVTERQVAGEQGPITYELEIIAKDGHRVPLELSTRVIWQQGKPIGVQGVGRDVTERKKADAALAASHRQIEQEGQLATALARVGQELIASLNMPALLDRLCRLTAETIGCDCCHTYLWQPDEDAFVAVAGYGDTAEEWETVRLLKLPPTMVAGLEQGLLQAVVAELPDGAPGVAVAAQYGVTAGLGVPLRRGGEIVGMLTATYRGRSEPFTPQQERLARGIAHLASLALQNARLIAELEQANRTKSDFVATMSHELRSPLHLIIGYGGLLLDGEFGPLAPDQDDSLRRMDKSARELLDLVNNTLDLSRLESERVALERKEVSMTDLLDEIAAETRLVLEKPQVRFEWQVDSPLPSLSTDPMKLKLIIKNLITNAIKFTDQGRITVAAHPRGAGVECAVSDTGIGIEPEARALIFEPFRQAFGATARHYGGAGLGLYIVRRLLNMLGGSVTVESEVGRGSTFRVWIPRDATAAQPPPSGTTETTSTT